MKLPVTVNESVLKQSAEIPIDTDFTLPDYCPEITKILKCKTDIFILSKGINGKNINIDGNVLITLIYISPESSLYSYEYQYPFNKVFEGDDNVDGADIFAAARTDYINCRAVTARKIDIHGALTLKVEAQKKKTIEIISDVDDDTIELNRAVIPATTPLSYAEKYISIEEETDIGQSQESIECILRYEAVPHIKECKLLPNKAMIKGELCVKTVYITDDSKRRQMNTSIPFSQLLNIEGINEDCKCTSSCKLCSLEVKPSTNQDSKSFITNAKVLVWCRTFCENDVEVITDAYSRKYCADIKKSDIKFSKLCCEICENLNLKDTITDENLNIESVADMWYIPEIQSHSIENGALSIKGTVNVFLIVTDEDGDSGVLERKVPFDYSKELDCCEKALYCEPDVTVTSGSYIITSSDSIEVRLEICVKAGIYSENNSLIVTDVQLDSSKPVEKKSKGAMTVYFASCGEDIWSIAKKYCASVKEIKQINDLDTDRLECEKMLLIPMI